MTTATSRRFAFSSDNTREAKRGYMSHPAQAPAGTNGRAELDPGSLSRLRYSAREVLRQI